MREIILEKSFSADSIKKIEVEILNSNIAIIGSNDENKMKVEIIAKSFGWNYWARKEAIQEAVLAYNIYVEEQNGDLVVNISPKNVWKNWLSSLRFTIRIFVPANGYIDCSLDTSWGDISLENSYGKHSFKTNAGQISMKQVRGEVRGKTLAGPIDIKQCKAKLYISTSAGTIEVEDSEGEMSFSTSAGTIELDDLIGNIQASTSAGTIEAKRIDGSLKLSTTAGTIEVDAMRGNLEAYTGGGTIEAEILELGNVLSLESKLGNVYVRMPFDKGMNLEVSANNIKIPHLHNFEGSHERGFIKGKFNGGGTNVQLKSKTGNVAVHSLKGGSFQHFGQSFKNVNFTLPPNFFARNIEGFFISLLICVFLVYGLNAIVFLSSELLSSHPNTADLYRRILLSNVTNGITTLITVFVFTKLESRIENPFLKYFVLIISTLCATIIGQMAVWANFKNLQSTNSTMPIISIFYILIPSIVACIYFFFWQRSSQITKKISEQEFKLVSLEKLKTQAELDALQARINPHFLYNSLNSIASLVHTDPDKAETMTMLLSKLFRYTTGTKDQHYNTIANELEIVKTYLDIEQVRFGDRLHYSVELEKSLETIEIPRFLLQPIVENAIKHGISKIAEQGKIEVKIKKENNEVILSVHDNGPNFPPDFFTGYGLQSIQDKLKLLYADKAKFEVQPTDYKAIIIKLPC